MIFLLLFLVLLYFHFLFTFFCSFVSTQGAIINSKDKTTRTTEKSIKYDLLFVLYENGFNDIFIWVAKI